MYLWFIGLYTRRRYTQEPSVNNAVIDRWGSPEICRIFLVPSVFLNGTHQKNNSAGLLCHVLVCVRSHEGVVRRNAGDNLTSMLNFREKTRFGERNEI